MEGRESEKRESDCHLFLLSQGVDETDDGYQTTTFLVGHLLNLITKMPSMEFFFSKSLPIFTIANNIFFIHVLIGANLSDL